MAHNPVSEVPAFCGGSSISVVSDLGKFALYCTAGMINIIFRTHFVFVTIPLIPLRPHYNYFPLVV